MDTTNKHIGNLLALCWTVNFIPVGPVLGYKPAPDTLIGRIPIYERCYVPKELSLSNKDCLFSALIRGEIFETEEEAATYAQLKNEEQREALQILNKNIEEQKERDDL